MFFSFLFFFPCLRATAFEACKIARFFPQQTSSNNTFSFPPRSCVSLERISHRSTEFYIILLESSPRLTSIQFNSSREPSLESTRTVFSPPLFPYFLASYPSEPPSEFFQKSVPTEFHASQKFSPVWRIRLEKYRIKFLSSTCQRLVWTSKWVVSAIVDRSFSQERYYQRRYRLRHVSPTIPEYLSILFFFHATSWLLYFPPLLLFFIYLTETGEKELYTEDTSLCFISFLEKMKRSSKG